MSHFLPVRSGRSQLIPMRHERAVRNQFLTWSAGSGPSWARVGACELALLFQFGASASDRGIERAVTCEWAQLVQLV